MTALRVADFDFHLPPELIAQQPPAERGQSRMLVVSRADGALRDASFVEFPSLLKPGDKISVGMHPRKDGAAGGLLADEQQMLINGQPPKGVLWLMPYSESSGKSDCSAAN